jgi:hypothetical protein
MEVLPTSSSNSGQQNNDGQIGQRKVGMDTMDLGKAGGTAPPSGLPAISPTRGEIGSVYCVSSVSDGRRLKSHLPITL